MVILVGIEKKVMVKNLRMYVTGLYHQNHGEVIILQMKIIRLKVNKIDIYLDFTRNDNFQEYIAKKYPKIKFENIKDYDYYINCTIYDKDFSNLDNNNKSVRKYISHEITDRLIVAAFSV